MKLREDRKRRALHSLGLTDVKIAEICGVSTQAIKMWRNRRGLKTVGKKGGLKTSQKEHLKRLELYWRGHTDMKIAKLCGITVGTMHYWRNQHGLPPSHARDRVKTLCWECARAYASRCPWVNKRERVWKRAKESGNTEDGYVVIECGLFEIEGKEEAEMREELETARKEYKIAEIEFNYADSTYQEAAILKLNAAREKLNAVIREAKIRAMAERKGGGAA